MDVILCGFCDNPVRLVSLPFYTEGIPEAESCELVNDGTELQNPDGFSLKLHTLHHIKLNSP